jgi:ABC-2 type transport system permease protein
MAGALAFGAAESLRLQRERETAAVADRALWLGQSAKNPHLAAHFGQYAFKPVSPLTLADPGVNAFVGSAVWLEAHKQNEARFRLARDSGGAARLGGLSLAFVIQIIAPLIIIMTGFAAFSRERESGTLRQLLGAGARSTDLLAGKALALFGVASLLLANGFVAPRVASGMARIAAPTPSASAFRAAIARDEAAASFGHDESHPAYRAFLDEMLKKYGVTRAADLPVSLRGLSLRRRDEIGYAVFDRHFGALQAAYHRQDALRALPGFVFPLLALQPLSMALAGSDSRSQFDFETMAEAHRRTTPIRPDRICGVGLARFRIARRRSVRRLRRKRPILARSSFGSLLPASSPSSPPGGFVRYERRRFGVRRGSPLRGAAAWPRSGGMARLDRSGRGYPVHARSGR